MGKDRLFYPAVFTYEKDKEIAVVFPDLNCATSGTDDNDAFLSARELLGCVIFGLEQDNEKIPPPTPLYKVKTADNEKALLIDVYMPAIRLEQENKAVSRTVTVPSWLNARALAENINFSQTLQEALCRKLKVTSR